MLNKRLQSIHSGRQSALPTALLAGLILAHIIAVFILAGVPPIEKDTLIHHLAVPKLYLQYGLFKNMPAIQYSYYPMNLQLLYMIPLYLGNDIIPKYIHYGFAILTAILIFSYLKKRLNYCYGLFGALFFLSTPIIIKLSISAYVDLGLIFFSTASIMALLRWIEHDFHIKHLIISGIFCGLALGTKYNGLVIFTFLFLFVIYFYSKAGAKVGHYQIRAIKHGLIFTITALCLFAPWMIKDYLQTGNPVYPLYDSLFNPTIQSSRAFNHRTHFIVRKVIYKETLWETLLVPIRVFFEGQDGNPKYFDGKLNPFLFILPILLIFFKHSQTASINIEVKIWYRFAVLVLLFCFLIVEMRIRWIAPIIPPLVILSVFSLHRIQITATRHLSELGGFIVIVLICIAACTVNIRYLYDQYKIVEPFSFLSGKVSRDAYIKKFRAEYSTIQYANEKLPLNAKILFLFVGFRRYYCDREVVIEPEVIKSAVQESHNIEMIGEKLTNAGITHLLFNKSLFLRWIDRTLDANQQKKLKFFFRNHTSLMFAKDGYELYRLNRL